MMIVHSCQRPPLWARRSEASRLRSGRSTDRHADKEGNLRGNAVLDGARGHPAVRLRLKGQTLLHRRTFTHLALPLSSSSVGFKFKSRIRRTSSNVSRGDARAWLSIFFRQISTINEYVVLSQRWAAIFPKGPRMNLWLLQRTGPTVTFINIYNQVFY